MGCQRSNLGELCARQTPCLLYYGFSPIPLLIFIATIIVQPPFLKAPATFLFVYFGAVPSNAQEFLLGDHMGCGVLNPGQLMQGKSPTHSTISLALICHFPLGSLNVSYIFFLV